MTRALIGHTGFVGSNLARQQRFDACFNSKSIHEMRGRAYEEVWCAGVQAVKWWANANPAEDWAGITSLLEVLDTVEAERFVLLSTVDVFARPSGVDEADEPVRDGLHPYGLHRLRVEDRIAERFVNHLIIRLPGLYGDGLKKNVIYDLLHDNQLGDVHADAAFQFYGLDRLSEDVDIASAAGLPLVHFATEAVSVAELARAAFGRAFDDRPSSDPPRYDVRTRHAAPWGRQGRYIRSRDEVLADIAAFVERERRRAA